ncbi:MAG: ABC transporter ATP-binding protein [Spirochaetia bacterium]
MREKVSNAIATYLKIYHLSKDYPTSYSQFSALKNVCLDIAKGEFIVVLGPSGSGKSTLLSLIAGLEKPTRGHIELDGKDFTKIPPQDRNLGMVFQNPVLYPHLNIYENLVYPLKNQKKQKSEILEKIEKFAHLFHIKELLQRMPNQLSGGQRQRICMAKALIKNPHLCLFDEPLSALDAQLRNQMIHDLKTLHQSLGFTAIYVTHDQTEATELATKIAIFDNGQCRQFDSPIALHNKPGDLFTANFFGFSSMFFLDATSYQNALHIEGIPSSLEINFQPNTQQNSFIFAIRPEYILINTPLSQSLEIPFFVKRIQPLALLTQVFGQIGEKSIAVQFASQTIEPYLNKAQIMLTLPLSKILVYEKESTLLLGYFSDFCYHDR